MISLFYIAYLVCVSSFPMPKLVTLNPNNQSFLANRCSARVVTSWGTNRDACPCGGTQQIMEVNRCRRAEAWLRSQTPKRSRKYFNRNNGVDPSGCVWRKDNDVFFNSVTNGRRHKLTGRHRERALVCATPAVLRLGGTATQCNDGEEQVESVEQCKAAGQLLGFGWNDRFPSANTGEPSGCVWRIDGDLIFNTFSDGPTHKITDAHERQIVCVTAGSFI